LHKDVKGDSHRTEISLKQWGSMAKFLIGTHGASEWGLHAQNRRYHRKSEIYVSCRDKDLGFLRRDFYSVMGFSTAAWRFMQGRYGSEKHTCTEDVL